MAARPDRHGQRDFRTVATTLREIGYTGTSIIEIISESPERDIAEGNRRLAEFGMGMSRRQAEPPAQEKRAKSAANLRAASVTAKAWTGRSAIIAGKPMTLHDSLAGCPIQNLPQIEKTGAPKGVRTSPPIIRYPAMAAEAISV